MDRVLDQLDEAVARNKTFIAAKNDRIRELDGKVKHLGEDLNIYRQTPDELNKDLGRERHNLWLAKEEIDRLKAEVAKLKQAAEKPPPEPPPLQHLEMIRVDRKGCPHRDRWPFRWPNEFAAQRELALQTCLSVRSAGETVLARLVVDENGEPSGTW